MIFCILPQIFKFPAMEHRVSPVAVKDRIQILDILRGFAIFGILMVNMYLFYNPLSYILIGSQSGGALIPVLSESFIKFFFEGKFYAMFSMLFGYGFWLFINKPVSDGVRIIPVFLRRMFFLLLFGIAHIVLLWPGDILFFYALFGFALVLFRNMSDDRLISWAVSFALVPAVASMFFMALFAVFAHIPEAAEAIDNSMAESAVAMRMLADEAMKVYTTGSWVEIAGMRIREWTTLSQGGIFMFYPVVLGMFLFGAWIARRGYVSNYRDHLTLIRRTFWWSLGLGLVFNTLYTISYQHAIPTVFNSWSFLGAFTHTAGGISFSLFYATSFILLISKGKIHKFAQQISAVGRMALTNYLLHSIICTTLFLSYGFGLMGKIEIWQGILLTIVIYALQIPFSNWWLSKFKYGPFEWLWRSLTYWKIQAFRITN